MMIYSTKNLRKYVDFKLQEMSFLKTIFSGLIFVFIISFIKNLLQLNVWTELFISISIGTAVYVLLIFALRIINLGEIRNIVNSSQKN